MKRFIRISIVLILTTVASTLSLYGSGWRLYQMADNSSMYPTLKEGTYYIADVSFSAEKLEAKDVVMIYGQSLGYNYLLTKRIIAVPGDVVSIKNNSFFVNGSPREEPYAYYGNDTRANLRDMPPMVIPEKKYFMVGDNRNNSRDSRDPSFGLVNADWIHARVVRIF